MYLTRMRRHIKVSSVITPHHITSHHIHITSHHITSHHITSHHIHTSALCRVHAWTRWAASRCQEAARKQLAHQSPHHAGAGTSPLPNIVPAHNQVSFNRSPVSSYTLVMHVIMLVNLTLACSINELMGVICLFAAHTSSHHNCIHSDCGTSGSTKILLSSSVHSCFSLALGTDYQQLFFIAVMPRHRN